MTNEAQFIEEICRARREERRFFSNDGKPERERWVVAQFLRNLSLSFREDELISLEQNNDADVLFRDASFQVKEITDPICKRDREVKEDLKRAENASRLEEVFEPSIGGDIVHVDAYPLVLAKASDVKYSRLTRQRLDLLCYITRLHSYLNPSLIRPEDVAALGWRSISCVIGRHGFVLTAVSEAPFFLRRHSLAAHLASALPPRNHGS